jgi:GntR family transcriptional regulator/MocR family aminotransferase
MPKPRILLDWIALDRGRPIPLFRQIYFELRTAIIDGRLTASSSLPSTRTLAHELGVSRNTVLNAYDQLAAEGYLETSSGSSTKVAELTSGGDGSAGAKSARPTGNTAASPLSKRGQVLKNSTKPVLELPDAVAFTPGVPAFDEFPTKTWARLLSGQSHRMHPEMADNDAHIGGFGPLREVLTSYLRSSRMVECESDQIFVVSSARAGLDLICRLVGDPGASCLVEEPGYNAAKNGIMAAGLKTIPIPVDAEGLHIALGKSHFSDVRLAYVTPSHQWPTGVSLSAVRRQQLLEWAAQRKAWVIEDDYDSEFRFDSRPLATLQGLDGGRRVWYLGTFSKVLFPSLRTAYVVVPRPLISAFRQAIYFAGQEPALHVQAALAEFISEGYFFSHIRRMRRIYKRRQARFVETLDRELGAA